jgi:hypothetical protein
LDNQTESPDLKDLVRYNGQWYMLDKEVNGMAIVWRNGQVSMIRSKDIEARIKPKDIKAGKYNTKE